ncbi:protein-L-isoaspartate(D-aspartate) O-methyltransferase [Candidatus Endoriftia persephone]|jgi:protein-L-isoaspartate(D-aspartate) O-methyltransferase|uniref:Protein-L-isoaspartate O-methyltransferase n=3 Tax=Gammaproteobacteria TaxID=1236 RepID=G2FBC5_9GAMM|nr:protein-L-isoaspartate(D-aspartate) O-methyltransferase [Candidatus Endoriftia persephone]EGW56063.1 protein-L-isoaspartate O-methyltransferase [endosymbiont of Tevnia jerichonana (vent Tica)]USF88183.1 protein-L-isoaspartate(D-aspartate) O-methyltransferase [Candidatus Endoriftia persephone]
MQCGRGFQQLLVVLLWCGVLFPVAAEDVYRQQREVMLDEVERELRVLAVPFGLEGLSPRLRVAMADVPRHEFVPPQQRANAYQNRPLSIGYGQTISQPLIVALMTELLQVSAGDRVFELGTGSGYQAAVLDRLGVDVYSMEIVEELADQAKQRLQQLGFDRIRVHLGDGYHGLPQAAPFDAIIVTAAGSHVPPPLVRQLKRGGRMVLPVGNRYHVQQLVLVIKGLDGSLTTQEILPVSFVPLTGSH